MAVDVSIIVNGHTEGLLVMPSLRSAHRARSVAREHGINVETIYVLDAPDQPTIEQFSLGGERDARLITVQHRDLGLSRNAGVEAARGKWIAFLDGDDLWCETWIRDAFIHAEARGSDTIWHPEFNLTFGLEEEFFLHTDMENPAFDIGMLAITNCWTALCFASRDILSRVPYRAINLADQLGFEDWAWNMDVISAGLIHKTVPETVHAIRKKRKGLLQKSLGSLPNQTDLFRNLLINRKGVASDISEASPSFSLPRP
jgi:glycosyltransferase involved in cell wall biosynthesis